MSAHPAFPSVPPATGGQIDDRLLDEVIAATGRMMSGDGYNDADGALLTLTAQPLFEELRNWRNKAALIRELSLPDNVVMLRGVS